MKRRLLDRDEEARLVERWRHDRDGRALDRLMRAFEPLCRKWAHKYAAMPQQFDDLLQEARVGLLVALDKFDAAQGVRLATYAPFWIRHHLERSKEIGETGVRMPMVARRKLRRYSRDGDAGRAPADLRQLAESGARDFARVSIDTAPGDSHGPDGVDIAECADPESRIAETLDASSRRRDITLALTAFDARRRRIIEARFLCDEPATLDMLGRELGVTRERVRQLESAAIEALRQRLTEPVAE